MRKIITIGLEDIIDIAENDQRETYQILGALSENDVIIVENQDWIITYYNKTISNELFNFLASHLVQNLVFGIAVFEKK